MDRYRIDGKTVVFDKVTIDGVTYPLDDLQIESNSSIFQDGGQVPTVVFIKHEGKTILTVPNNQNYASFLDKFLPE